MAVLNVTSRRAGQQVTYRLRVANTTGRPVRDARVCDRMSPALRFVGSTCPHRIRDGRHCWSNAQQTIRVQAGSQPRPGGVTG